MFIVKQTLKLIIINEDERKLKGSLLNNTFTAGQEFEYKKCFFSNTM